MTPDETNDPRNGPESPDSAGDPTGGGGPDTGSDAPEDSAAAAGQTGAESGDPGSGDGGEDPGPSADDTAENRYRRSIAIALATLAVLAALIAILQGDAAGKESTSARDATRLATEAQAARVVQLGGDAVVQQVEDETLTLPLRPGFAWDLEVAGEAGIELDEANLEENLAAAEAELSQAFGFDAGEGTLFDLREEAHELSLSQAATVDERVTWNARASQYETVMTVLGVALFLVGFTAVVGRKLRPPLAVPGLLLAAYCLGWSIHIYLKDIPDVSAEVITATAEGQALLGIGDAEQAIPALDAAVRIDDTYRPAVQSRSVAQVLAGNPDLLNTMAITDTESDLFDAAVEDARSAFALGGEEDTTTLTLAGLLTFMSGDLDTSAEAFGRAVELNSLTPGIQFALSAVEAGRGNREAALEWRTAATELLGPVAESQQNRKYGAQYISQLEYLLEIRPEHAELIEALRDDSVLAEAETVAGELSGTSSGGELGTPVMSFEDGVTTADLIVEGVIPGETVTVVGYERPAPGAAYVQSPPLFYVGESTERNALEIPTPRSCHPVEFRFDLYVEGVFEDTVTAPGVAPTC